jgi:hypothetical protein
MYEVQEGSQTMGLIHSESGEINNLDIGLTLDT